MKELILFELTKLKKSRVLAVCLAALVFVMAGVIFAEYQDVVAYNTNLAYQAEVDDWRTREQNVIKFAGEALAEDDWMSPFEQEQVARRIAIAQYRLDNNIEKDVYKNVWWFFNDKAFNAMSTFVIVLSVLIACVCFAGEYAGGTIRQVLLLPYRRGRLLTAKVCAAALCGFGMYALLFVLGLVSGFVLHGADGFSAQVVLYYGSSITTMRMGAYSLCIVLLKMIDLVFYLLFALVLCIYTKSTAASAVTAGAVAALAVPLTNFVGVYYPVLFWLPFSNLDFRRFLDFGTVMPQIEAGASAVVQESITAPTAAAIVAVVAAVFLLAAVRRFRRQEV